MAAMGLERGGTSQHAAPDLCVAWRNPSAYPQHWGGEGRAGGSPSFAQPHAPHSGPNVAMSVVFSREVS